MNKREKFLKEIAEVINRNSMEAYFNDTPDYIYKKPEAFDVPKEVQAMAEFFGKMFPGSKVEIHRVKMPKRNPRDKRRAKNKRKWGNNGKK